MSLQWWGFASHAFRGVDYSTLKLAQSADNCPKFHYSRKKGGKVYSHAVLFRLLMLSCLCSLPTFTLLLSLVVINGGSEWTLLGIALFPGHKERRRPGTHRSACATSYQYDIRMPNTFLAWLFQLNDSVPLCSMRTPCSQSDVCLIAHWCWQCAVPHSWCVNEHSCAS